ncbi:polymeric immunoglobulin receptor-like isoform X1 [Scleropages formosus]|uniref:polymeric immunoglobulin receptor-like isoform X1 n=1 Tax=Scleropages formosus TaxID=113540 RepID=UPI0010FABEFC|nr:polymeric immunoglobulin receptor-like isoform X1 [Scleropages formosus]
MDPVVFLLLFVFLTTFPGAATVNTFKWLNARKGGSVTIPCFYDQEYRNSVKYWCKGSKRTVMVRTDSPQRNDQVSISDDPVHLVFYVTMRNLGQEDADSYWCAVKIDGVQDIFDHLQLYVLIGGQSVWTESWMSAERKGSVTIPCHYDQRYKHHVKYWCKGFRWESCSTMVRTNSPQSKGDVSITDDPNKLVFYVTMRNLREKDSDTYWCAVEINMGQDYGVFLPIVIGKASDALTTSESTLSSTGMKSQKDVSSPDSISVKNNSTLENNLRSSQQPVVLLILGLLLLVLGVTVAMGTLTMFRKQKEAQERKSETHSGPTDAGHHCILSEIHSATRCVTHYRFAGLNTEVCGVSQPTSDSEVFYSTLLHKKPAERRNVKEPLVNPEDEVIYSDTV